MLPYVDHLIARFREAGGEIEQRRLVSLEEAAELVPRVANCSGLGARHLVPDPEVTPLCGPKIIVANPGIDTFFIEGPPGAEWTSYHPHGGTVVLGGSATTSDDVTPRPREAERIVRRCAEVEPRLTGARIIEHRVGLRPARPDIRVEATAIDGATCVHNYGHGSVGVTTAWGCAVAQGADPPLATATFTSST